MIERDKFGEIFMPLCVNVMKSIDSCRIMAPSYYKEFSNFDPDKLEQIFKRFQNTDSNNLPSFDDIRRQYYEIANLEQQRREIHREVYEDPEELVRRQKAHAKFLDETVVVGLKCQRKNAIKTNKTGCYQIGHILGLWAQSEIERRSKKVS